EAFEILIVDNGSVDAETNAFLQGLDALGDPRLKVFRFLDRVGLPSLYNLLAAEAAGKYLILMHFDCTPLDPAWLDTLVGELHRPGVGLVAPRLLDGQGKIRGGGAILGVDGGYAPAFAGLSHDDPGPWGRAHAAQSFSALTGGVWLVEREVFTALNGLQADMGPAAEVDFCLRLGEAGYQALWTPYVSMLTDGAAWAVDWLGNGTPVPGDKIGMDDPSKAVEPLLRRWLSRMSPDPAYNRNLSTYGVPFSVETRSVLQTPTLPWKPLPRVLVHPADTTGCGHYRILQPARALMDAGAAETIIGHHILQATDLVRVDADAVVFQRQLYEPQVRRMRQTREYYKPFMVFELDDLITNLPSKNLHRDTIPGDTGRWLREACSLCDRFVVSTEPLKRAMKDYNDDIRVVPNLIDAKVWGALQAAPTEAGKPRVGWAGGISHTGDLDLIADVVKELAGEVDWVFLGMCPDSLRPYVAEFHPGVPIDKYPAKLASLNLDLAVAPLEFNAFNEAKSNLKLLEYGALGYPVICTDIVPYQCGLPVTLVKNRFRDWVGAIREHLSDRNELRRRGDLLKRSVYDGWTMDQHIATWLSAWTR
ncbi:MAG: glycosyltransferase, partial [Burkholderiales bacterium]|nr:glycosyltransferase [Burkholderiales bacterium]